MTLKNLVMKLTINAILACHDPLTLDCNAVKIGGINPFNVRIHKTAAERGIVNRTVPKSN